MPHSDIPGSKPARGSPGRFAARCVLHRRLSPRHPPRALSTLSSSIPIFSPNPPALTRWSGRSPSNQGTGRHIVLDSAHTGSAADAIRESLPLRFRNFPQYPALARRTRQPSSLVQGTYGPIGPWEPDVKYNAAIALRKPRPSAVSRQPHHAHSSTWRTLRRKEVIQPHLPIRLPCYDFVPITSHTFGASLLAVGPATSGTPGFRDVTGGVYKARERIHRSVADLRLLVIPTSCRRVAACNPN